MREQYIRKIIDEKVMAIVRGIYGEECLQLAEALHAGGVNLMEVTFNQKDEKERELTAETIKMINDELGNDMLIGAGTVTSPEMVRAAKNAGAKFIVSPDTNTSVIAETISQDMVSIPGALTPTEIQQAYLAGADFVKVFPATFVGPKYIKDVRAPLNHVRMLAVGGVNLDNVDSFIEAGVSGVGVAGCLFKKEWVKNKEWDKITNASKIFVEKFK